jgi:hypothetical protein
MYKLHTMKNKVFFKEKEKTTPILPISTRPVQPCPEEPFLSPQGANGGEQVLRWNIVSKK